MYNHLLEYYYLNALTKFIISFYFKLNDFLCFYATVLGDRLHHVVSETSKREVEAQQLSGVRRRSIYSEEEHKECHDREEEVGECYGG